jgi:6-phosphogluconate dehydrogenase
MAPIRLQDRLWQGRGLKDLELALFAAKIGAYAQGFAVMAEASREFNWNAADADDRQNLARRLHHPLAVPRRDHAAFTKAPNVDQPDRTPAFVRYGQGRFRRFAGSSPPPSRPACRFRHSLRR